ncbi:MAG: NADPH-dependent curcumin reductase CurA [Acidimicrobiales bacterium]|jgi:NADPH-dependent curcumin reductase CurA
MSDWIDGGQLVPRVSEFDGLASARRAFVELLAGGTVGTTIVRVSKEPKENLRRSARSR